jgi:hypothetical protein
VSSPPEAARTLPDRPARSTTAARPVLVKFIVASELRKATR